MSLNPIWLNPEAALTLPSQALPDRLKTPPLTHPSRTVPCAILDSSHDRERASPSGLDFVPEGERLFAGPFTPFGHQHSKESGLTCNLRIAV